MWIALGVGVTLILYTLKMDQNKIQLSLSLYEALLLYLAFLATVILVFLLYNPTTSDDGRSFLRGLGWAALGVPVPVIAHALGLV